MDNSVLFGYLQYAFDDMYLEGIPLTDNQREQIFNALYEALDFITEEEALDYYKNNPNSNLGR